MAMGNLPPFEDWEAHGGFFRALIRTWIGACFRPTEFFRSVGNSQDLSPALLFGVLIGWESILVWSLWALVFKEPFPPIMRREDTATRYPIDSVNMLLYADLFGWLFALLGIFIGGLITHLFLMIFGGANQGLTMTLRVISYAYAPLILTVVPFVGSFVALIWLLLLAIIGLAAAHRTDTWRTALAVLVPMVLGISAIALTTFLGGVTQTLIP